MILEEIKEEYVKGLLLAKGKRVDNRELLQHREIKIDSGPEVLPNAEGGALASIGDTKVLAGVKFDLMTPYRDKPDEGVLSFMSEFSPIASPNFSSGPPSPLSIELSRVVDRGIRSAECVDTKKFFLEEDKVFGLFVDMYVLDHSGNLIDCAALAAMSALLNTKVPKYEDGKILREEFAGKLEVQRPVVACSFENISGKFLLDATDEEEAASDGRLTLSTCPGELICSAQKSGKAGLKKDDLLQLIDITLEKGEELRKKL